MAMKRTSGPRPPIQLRPLKFPLLADVRTWHRAGPDIALFMNALSTFFPIGERFFIESVQYYRDRIDDPELLKQIKLFAGQEGIHGREHEAYNAKLQEAGYPVRQLEKRVVEYLLSIPRRRAPHRRQLAITAALEHFTAVLAHALLSEPVILKDSDPVFAALWKWHAVEETEHKAVAFDVYEKMGGNYVERNVVMAVVTACFLAAIVYHTHTFLKTDGRAWRPKPWANIISYTLLSPGVLRSAVRHYWDYFKPGFHPWKHDNRYLLDRFYSEYPEFVATLERARKAS